MHPVSDAMNELLVIGVMLHGLTYKSFVATIVELVVEQFQSNGCANGELHSSLVCLALF